VAKSKIATVKWTLFLKEKYAEISTSKQMSKSAFPLSKASHSGGLIRVRRKNVFSLRFMGLKNFTEMCMIAKLIRTIMAGARMEDIRARSIK
jgi:hypothetical protein